MPAGELAARLARQGIFASHGNFYAQTVVQRLGHEHDGLLRLGCACYTSEEEVGRVIDAVRRIARGQA
jgi:selenocysteine lyase/cysteine desulfurase